MPKNFLNKINFEINKDVKFIDPKVQMVEAVYKTNELKRDDIIHNMNVLAQQFNSSKVHLGCAIHYKKLNRWCAAIMKPTNTGMEIWTPEDSPGIEDIYKGDVIDGIHIMIMNYNAENTKVSYYTPKKTHHLH
jgi:hypothetical protein